MALNLYEYNLKNEDVVMLIELDKSRIYFIFKKNFFYAFYSAWCIKIKDFTKYAQTQASEIHL